MILTHKEFCDRWSIFWTTVCPDKIGVTVLQITTISITMDISRDPGVLANTRLFLKDRASTRPFVSALRSSPASPNSAQPLSLADAKLSPKKLPSQLCTLRASGGVQGQRGRKEGASSSRLGRALRYKMTGQAGLLFLLKSKSTLLPNGSCFSRNY